MTGPQKELLFKNIAQLVGVLLLLFIAAFIVLCFLSRPIPGNSHDVAEAIACVALLVSIGLTALHAAELDWCVREHPKEPTE